MTRKHDEMVEDILAEMRAELQGVNAATKEMVRLMLKILKSIEDERQARFVAFEKARTNAE